MTMVSSRLSVFLSYAFRPFFLLNAALAVILILLWLSFVYGHSWLAPANPLLWHGHEMLVGFVMGAVAGFSLTAVATWTGRPAIHGPLLGLLVLTWLAGRLVMAFSPCCLRH
jgi:uncharacterized protein involved in response to NO